MLTGIYTYSIDQKGRIVMPNRFLDEIGNPFVLGGHPNGYLVAASSPDIINGKSGFRGYAECQIRDRTGRFVIPSALREFAELSGSGEATVVGVGDEVEIWNKRRWDSVARMGSAPARVPFEEGASQSASSDLRKPGARPANSQFHSGGSRVPEHAATGFPHKYVPRSRYAPEGATIQQKAIYGQPYIEVEGSLDFVETDKVLARLDTALRGRPRTVFLDLRRVDTVDASFLMAMEPATYQLAATGGRLAVLTERQDVAALIHRICDSTHTRVFPDLESALWWLVDEGHA
jgi:MraZ protein